MPVKARVRRALLFLLAALVLATAMHAVTNAQESPRPDPIEAFVYGCPDCPPWQCYMFEPWTYWWGFFGCESYAHAAPAASEETTVTPLPQGLVHVRVERWLWDGSVEVREAIVPRSALRR